MSEFKDTPGHCLGHMCGLARTTGGPNSTFALLGGDICHFAGCIRPSTQIPLPDTISDGFLDADAYFPKPCPCSLFVDCHPSKKSSDTASSLDGRVTPFYRISTDQSAAYADPHESQVSVDKLVHFDASDSVLICLAHDDTMLYTLPTLNSSPEDDLNNWQRRGYKKHIHWGWLNHLSRGAKPGREEFVKGFWRDEKPWADGKQELRRKGEIASKFTL